jgi:hypothetical protein
MFVQFNPSLFDLHLIWSPNSISPPGISGDWDLDQFARERGRKAVLQAGIILPVRAVNLPVPKLL